MNLKTFCILSQMVGIVGGKKTWGNGGRGLGEPREGWPLGPLQGLRAAHSPVVAWPEMVKQGEWCNCPSLPPSPRAAGSGLPAAPA